MRKALPSGVVPALVLIKWIRMQHCIGLARSETAIARTARTDDLGGAIEPKSGCERHELRDPMGVALRCDSNMVHVALPSRSCLSGGRHHPDPHSPRKQGEEGRPV